METGVERRTAAWAAAEHSDGVVSRAALRAVGIDRNAVGREVAAGRWRLHGAQTVAVHTGSLSEVALRWRAVWEVGGGAVLDGVSALLAAGLQGFDTDVVHVSIDHDQRARSVSGVRIHQVREPLGPDTLTVGAPRVRPGVAAVRAAQWAVSDRQAALILCLAAQQRLVHGSGFCDVRWPGAHYGRTALVRQLLKDVTRGAHSLGELDFGRLCRDRGLPPPARQVVRQGPRGRIYLDARWDRIGLVVEIDGAQHRQGLAVTADNLRRNHLALADEVVLTIDLVGLRLEGALFMDQVENAFAVLSQRRPA